MNLTWHIVKKDLRALKWPLLIWVLLIVAKLVTGVMLLSADGTEDPEWFRRLDALSKILAGLECVSFVLAAALIQEDLLVGTSAFWVTRPISGARLLRAKLLGLVLIFGLLPLLITLPWWLWCGFGWRDLAWASMETIILHAICVLVGLLWAVVTDGFARFLMWTLVMFVAILTIAAVVGFHLSKLNPRVPDGVILSRIWLVIGLAVVGIATVVIHQFLTRRTWRSIPLIGAFVGLMIMVALWWPWNWNLAAKWDSYLQAQVEERWPTSARPAGMGFTFKDATLLPHAPGARGDRPFQLRVNYRVAGLLESQALVPMVANYTILWPDGSNDASWSWVRTEAGDGLSGLMEKKVLGVTSTAADTTIDSRAMQAIPATAAVRLQAGPAVYSLKLRYALMEISSAASVPQQSGPRMLSSARGERITHVDKEGEQLMVTMVRHHPVPAIDFLMGVGSYIIGASHALPGQFFQYLLVNKAQNYSDRGRTVWEHRTRVAAVEIAWQTTGYRASKKGGGPRPVLEAINALKEAELVRVTFQEKARFAYGLTVDPFVITPAGP
ncbi:MAG: hypothetical protein WCR49_13250 [Opitutae bacterium]